MPENAGFDISPIFWDVTGIGLRGPLQDDAGVETGLGFTRPVLLGIEGTYMATKPDFEHVGDVTIDGVAVTGKFGFRF